jgi:hypothetical protein
MEEVKYRTSIVGCFCGFFSFFPKHREENVI